MPRGQLAEARSRRCAARIRALARSEVPAHIPCNEESARAQFKHSTATGHLAQRRRASKLMVVPSAGKKSSTSCPRQAERARQSARRMEPSQPRSSPSECIIVSAMWTRILAVLLMSSSQCSTLRTTYGATTGNGTRSRCLQDGGKDFGPLRSLAVEGDRHDTRRWPGVTRVTPDQRHEPRQERRPRCNRARCRGGQASAVESAVASGEAAWGLILAGSVNDPGVGGRYRRRPRGL